MSLFGKKKTKKPPEYSAEDYKRALTDLDEVREDDFFGRKSYTETASSVGAVIKAMIYIIFILACSGALAYFIIDIANDVFSFVKPEDTVTITVPEGAGAAEIADALAEAGVIKYPRVFKLYAKLKKVDQRPERYDFVPGVYEDISAPRNYDGWLLAFGKDKTIKTGWVTIPEGYTVDQIIKLFSEIGIDVTDEATGNVEKYKIGTVESWTEAINNFDTNEEYNFCEKYPYLSGLTLDSGRAYKLEGYLFPDRYNVYVGYGYDEYYYLAVLLRNFDSRIKELNLAESAEKLGITIDQALIIASVIEKEIYYQPDADLVATVIWNRINLFNRDGDNAATVSAKTAKAHELFGTGSWVLQCDSTLIYSLSHSSGTRVTTLTADDLQSDDPYNSYKVQGFVPGPIGNPGFNAISCALNPQTEKDNSGKVLSIADRSYYFITDADNYVQTSSTLAEHEKKINERRAELDRRQAGE
ncbi:MAG: endolytic transglycosylase MltG [Clostridia bacterium]|nr:endolytic transglycosylase MltG [Clostridia bacterium]